MAENRIDIIINTQWTGKGSLKQVKKELTELQGNFSKSSSEVQKSGSEISKATKSAGRSAEQLSLPFKEGTSNLEAFGGAMGVVQTNFGGLEGSTGSATSSMQEFKGAMGVTRMNQFTQSQKEATTATGNQGNKLDSLAWSFRYLNSVVDQGYQSFVRFTQQLIDTGVELEETFFALETSAHLFGYNVEELEGTVSEFADTGITSLSSTAEAARDLASTGADIEVVEDVMYRYSDVTSLLTSNHQDMERSMKTLTESILRGTTVLATDTSARLVWNMANQRAEKTHGKTLENLSMEQRMLMIQKTLKEDLASLEGLHRAEMALTSAQITKTQSNWQELQYEIFQKLTPIIYLTLDGLNKLMEGVSNITSALGDFAPALYTVTGAGFALATALTSVMAIGLVLLRITGPLGDQINDLTMDM
ncbi:MAG: hypothetical protein ACOCTT_01565, partial [archaeon]